MLLTGNTKSNWDKKVCCGGEPFRLASLGTSPKGEVIPSVTACGRASSPKGELKGGFRTRPYIFQIVFNYRRTGRRLRRPCFDEVSYYYYGIASHLRCRGGF